MESTWQRGPTSVCPPVDGWVNVCAAAAAAETLQRPSPLTYSGDADSQIPGVFMEGRSVMATRGIVFKMQRENEKATRYTTDWTLLWCPGTHASCRLCSHDSTAGGSLWHQDKGESFHLPGNDKHADAFEELFHSSIRMWTTYCRQDLLLWYLYQMWTMGFGLINKGHEGQQFLYIYIYINNYLSRPIVFVPRTGQLVWTEFSK